MKRRCRRFLSALLAAVLVCLSGIPRGYAQITEGYTYTVTNYPGRAQGVQANLYICEERPAAGDIFCAGADGFQEGLAFPKS